jgi:hypothetical protein
MRGACAHQEVLVDSGRGLLGLQGVGGRVHAEAVVLVEQHRIVPRNAGEQAGHLPDQFLHIAMKSFTLHT